MIAIKHLALDLPFPETITERQDWLEKQIGDSQLLHALILEYEYGNGKLQLVKIVPGSLILNSSAHGQFKVGYELNEYSLCAAIDYTAAHHMLIKFSINDQEVILTGEDRRERADEL